MLSQKVLFDQFTDPLRARQLPEAPPAPDWFYFLDEIEHTKGLLLNDIPPREHTFNITYDLETLSTSVTLHYPRTANGYHSALFDIKLYQMT